MTSPLIAKLITFGLETKVGMEAGKIEDVAKAVGHVDAVIARLSVGAWGVERTGAASAIPLLVRAVAEVTGKTVEQVQTYIAKKVAEGTARKTLNAKLRTPKVTLVMARLEAEEESATDEAGLAELADA